MKIGKIIGKTIKYSILALLCACVLYWAFSIIKCEVLTIMYYDDFAPMIERESKEYFGGINSFKVLSYNGKEAKVYAISRHNTLGEIFECQKISYLWHAFSVDSRWSTFGGNADEPVWPYIWHRQKYRLSDKERDALEAEFDEHIEKMKG